MRTLVFLLAALGVSTLLYAESLPPSVDLADPSTLVSRQTCDAQCEAVYADCRDQCGEYTARAREEHFDLANAVVGECLKSC